MSRAVPLLFWHYPSQSLSTRQHHRGSDRFTRPRPPSASRHSADAKKKGFKAARKADRGAEPQDNPFTGWGRLLQYTNSICYEYRKMTSKLKEVSCRWCLPLSAPVSILAVAPIRIFLLANGVPTLPSGRCSSCSARHGSPAPLRASRRLGSIYDNCRKAPIGLLDRHLCPACQSGHHRVMLPVQAAGGYPTVAPRLGFFGIAGAEAVQAMVRPLKTSCMSKSGKWA